MSAHELFMDRALLLAEEAVARGDWPVAAVIVKDSNIIVEGQGRQATRDTTWHAESMRCARLSMRVSTLLGPLFIARWSRARCVPGPCG